MFPSPCLHCQESSVQEEVEMMVESLLDVLLQTLLSIMSKSHSVETSRGQRCPQCTAEITVSSGSVCRFDVNQKQVGLSEYFELINLWSVSACICRSPTQGEYVSCLLSLLRQMTEIHFHHLLNNFHSKEELKVGNSDSQRWAWLQHFAAARSPNTLTALLS